MVPGGEVGPATRPAAGWTLGTNHDRIRRRNPLFETASGRITLDSKAGPTPSKDEASRGVEGPNKPTLPCRDEWGPQSTKVPPYHRFDRAPPRTNVLGSRENKSSKIRQHYQRYDIDASRRACKRGLRRIDGKNLREVH